MIKKLLTGFFLFSICLGAEAPGSDWVQKAIEAPDQYFSDAYESHIFKQFVKKFNPVRVTGVSGGNNLYTIRLKPGTFSGDYTLMFKTDAEGKINQVHRSLNQPRKEKIPVTEELIIRWIGKFLYHLDAGDPEAMYDLVYHNETLLHYGDLDDKKQIIARLLRDFPSIIVPDQINIEARDTNYAVEVYIHLRQELILKINSRLANITNTDELQESLFEKIDQELETGGEKEKPLVWTQFFATIKSSYQYVDLRNDTLTVHYPSFGMKTMKNMQYLIRKNTAGAASDQFQLEAMIKLEPDFSKGVVKINDSYNLSTYIDPQLASPDLALAEDLLRKIFNQFITLPFSPLPTDTTVISGAINYRGYRRHQLKIKDVTQWICLWQTLAQEGSIYFLPSALELKEDQMTISGLIYILKDVQMNFYHFAELIVVFSSGNNYSVSQFELNFYPFLSRAGVRNFKN